MRESIGPEIAVRARELGADLVGFVPSRALRESPSRHTEASRSASIDQKASRQGATAASPYDLGDEWSAIVLGLSHPTDRPELDWFTSSGNTPGNAAIITITRDLASWLEGARDCRTMPLHYYVEKGGVYLKDAAVHAGLGCIGRNNLLVTPEYGPRVRLRALMVNARLEHTGPSGFDPCVGCSEPCRIACPQGAFEAPSSELDMAERTRSARDGTYSRPRCMVQMDIEWGSLGVAAADPASLGMDVERIDRSSEQVVKHCRLCELACPVGSCSCT